MWNLSNKVINKYIVLIGAILCVLFSGCNLLDKEGTQIHSQPFVPRNISSDIEQGQSSGAGMSSPTPTPTASPTPVSGDTSLCQDCRVVISAKGTTSLEVNFPDPSEDWTLQYKFLVPALPKTNTWNYTSQVFYVWGDVDFDVYGANGPYPLSNYVYNQIVPQIQIGNSLAGNDSNYIPSWMKFNNWVIQAQYFWQNTNGAVYAQTGSVVNVVPGEVVTTQIQYQSMTGKIIAEISALEGTSTITIPRPFPNEKTPLFQSWRSFFELAAAKSNLVIGRPMINVESHGVDQGTLCSVLPFSVSKVSLPNIPISSASYVVGQVGNFSCANQLVQFSF